MYGMKTMEVGRVVSEGGDGAGTAASDAMYDGMKAVLEEMAAEAVDGVLADDDVSSDVKDRLREALRDRLT